MSHPLTRICLAVLVLFTADIVWGQLASYRTSVVTHVFPGIDNSRIVFVLPGWGQDGRAVGQILAEGQINQIATVVAFDYPHRGFYLRDIYRELIRQLKLHQPTAWTAVGGSMGGEIWFELMRHYRAECIANPYGLPLPPIFDSAPACPEDVMIPRWGFALMGKLGHGPIATALKAAIMKLTAVRPITPDPGIDPDALKRLYHMTTWYPFPGAAAQAKWMSKFDARIIGANSLVPAIHFIKGATDDDGLVRNRQAVHHWQKVTHVIVHTDNVRGARDHNTVTRPNFVAQIVATVFAQAPSGTVS